MNKNEITMEDLQIRILSFIEKAKSTTKNIHFNFNSSISDQFSFSSIKGINVFRIIQEALNNAIKYSVSSEISINITEGIEHIKITINDNGIGFDKTKVELGNGINNMQKRVQEIGGELSITSKINEGTSITIECLKNKPNAV